MTQRLRIFADQASYNLAIRNYPQHPPYPRSIFREDAVTIPAMNPTSSNLSLKYTLFCEDVRVEASGSLSLIGVFHQLVVPQLPVGLIKFAVLNHWQGEGQQMTEVRILTPDRMQTIAVSQPSGFEVPPNGYADNVTVFVNTSFYKPGDYIVQTLINSSLFAERILPVMLANQSNLANSDQAITHSDQVN